MKNCKKSFFLFISLTMIILSCSSVKNNNNGTQMSEILDGIILVTNNACFFVPNEFCKYLEWDNSKGSDVKALIVDHFTEKNEIQQLVPIVATICMLPNKDTSEAIEWLEWGKYDMVKKNECYIIPAKVSLETHFKPIELLSFTYNLRFKWEGTVYKFKCINNCDDISCHIISLNNHQRIMVLDSRSLPRGAEGD